LAEAVAEHLLAVAESHHPPAFVRTEALVALNWLLGHLTPQVNSHLVKRFLALAEDPGLSEDDQAELATQDPLSRGRVDLGARALSSLALYMAARAAAPAADPDVGAEGLPGDAAHRLIARTVQLLHSPDTETAKWGAAALAAASRTDPSRAHYGTALIVDPREDIRAAAVPRVVLDQTAQQLLAADSSPRVRAALAHRASELTEETLATLRADDHPEVTRALTAGAGPDGSNPNPPRPEHGGLCPRKRSLVRPQSTPAAAQPGA
jgi:hypothetical protein